MVGRKKIVDFNLNAEEVVRRLHCCLWSLLGTKSRSHGKPCKSQYHLQSTPFHFTLFFSILFILPLFRKFLQLLILDYSESPNNISISMAHGLTCFFLKEIARIPPVNMVFIRNKHLLPHETQIKQPILTANNT